MSSEFSCSSAKRALSDILKAFQQPENAQKLEQARAAAGNNVIELTKIAFPLTTQIQMEAIKPYGFTPDINGLTHFLQLVKSYEKQDATVAELYSELRSLVMPRMSEPMAPVQPT